MWSFERQSQDYSTRSTRTTRSSLSISRRRTSMISVSLVCTPRPIYCASIGISRWPRSMSTQRETRFGRPRSNIPFIAARIVRPVYRTIRAAMNGIFDLGRPKRVSLCVLIERGHREMPIEAQYIGRGVQTSDTEIIEVRLREIDKEERVVLVDRVE